MSNFSKKASQSKIFYLIIALIFALSIFSWPCTVSAAGGIGGGGGGGTGSTQLIFTSASLATLDLANQTAAPGESITDLSTVIPVNPTIKIVFSNNVTGDANWANNQNCIHLTEVSDPATSIPLTVTRLGGGSSSSPEKNNIYIQPNAELTLGGHYRLHFDSTLKANNTSLPFNGYNGQFIYDLDFYVGMAQVSVSPSPTSAINMLTRLGGFDRYETAVQIAGHGWQSASTAVLAPSGDRNMVDALASSSLAKAIDGPILLADYDSVPAGTMSELKKLGVTKVYLVSGTAVISAQVESQLTAADIQAVRLGGYDRYETAVNIAKEVQKIKPFQEVAVTNAYANVDAITIAPIAAAKGMSILLVDKDSVPAVVSDFIAATGINKTYIIGGTAVVSDSVKDTLANATRLGGYDRFDTNVEVLKHFENFIIGGSMFFANGSDTSLIDSLTGAPLAAKFDGAIVLSNRDSLPIGTKGFIQTDIFLKNPVILGGTAVMSDAVVQSLGYGTAPSGQSAILKGAVELNTSNETLKDVTVNGNIVINADGVTLQNVTVKGTVFVDPGKDGSAALDGVQATRIVVLSGAEHSVDLVGTKADSLVVSSSSPVHVAAKTGTILGSALVQSNAVLESQSGANVGVLSAQPRLNEPVNVQLEGVFSNDVFLSGSVKLTAADGVVIPTVRVAGAATLDSIQLAGTFSSVLISDNSPITLLSGKITEMTIYGTSNIIVNSGAEITGLTSATGKAIISGGGTVNGKPTTATPVEISVVTVVVTPVVNPGGNSGDPNSAAAPTFVRTEVTNKGDVSIYFSKTMADPIGKHGGFTVTVNGKSVTITGIELTNTDGKLKLVLADKLVGDEVVTVAYSKPSNSAMQITASDGGILDTFTSKSADGSALYDINNAAPNAAEMGKAIITYAETLGLDLTDYNSLSDKTPVYTALAWKDFDNKAAVKAAFDAAVAAQKSAEKEPPGGGAPTPTAVVLADGSLGTAGDQKISGLTSGTKYVVTSGGKSYGVQANGTLGAENSAAEALNGTEVTGLTNGTIYSVAVEVPAAPTAVVLAGGSLGAAGDQKITGLTSGKKYVVTIGTANFGVKADGTLGAENSAAEDLIGTEITGLTNGSTYSVAEEVPAAPTAVVLADGSLGTAADQKITGLTSETKYVVTSGGKSCGVQANGTLGAENSAAEALTGTEITGLTNGTTYSVAVEIPSAPTFVRAEVTSNGDVSIFFSKLMGNLVNMQARFTVNVGGTNVTPTSISATTNTPSEFKYKLTLPEGHKVINEVVTVTYTKDTNISNQFLAADGGILETFIEKPVTPKP